MLRAATVDTVLALLALVLVAGVLGLGIWAIRAQNRMFPKDFDRTGWNPKRGHAGWFRTKSTWALRRTGIAAR